MPSFRSLLAGLAAAALTTTAVVAPVQASDPDNVMGLVNAITSTGTNLYTDCPAEAQFAGMYASSHRALAICADGDLPTQFTPAEQDTLRHEGIHLAQDCMDRSFNNELETTRTVIGVMRMMAEASDVYNFEGIEKSYRQQGADDLTILLEFEAWAGAAIMTNAEVAHLVRTVCRV